MLSFGFDFSHSLSQTSDLGSFVMPTIGGNDLDNVREILDDLGDKCPANDMYSLPFILNIPLLEQKKSKTLSC